MGARVVVLDLPYQGSTPQAASEDRARLNSLTEAFNKGLRFNLPDNSRYIALVLANNRVELAQKTENSPYPFLNRTEAVCTTESSAKACTTATLKIADASSNRYEYVFATGAAVDGSEPPLAPARPPRQKGWSRARSAARSPISRFMVGER